MTKAESRRSKQRRNRQGPACNQQNNEAARCVKGSQDSSPRSLRSSSGDETPPEKLVVVHDTGPARLIKEAGSLSVHAAEFRPGVWPGKGSQGDLTVSDIESKANVQRVIRSTKSTLGCSQSCPLSALSVEEDPPLLQLQPPCHPTTRKVGQKVLHKERMPTFGREERAASLGTLDQDISLESKGWSLSRGVLGSASPQPFQDLSQCNESKRGFWCTPVPVCPSDPWAVYYDCATERGMKPAKFVESMSVLGSFKTMDEFMASFGCNMHRIASNGTLRVFKASVAPAWEDPANSGIGSGKWSILFPKKRISVSAFHALLEAMIQNQLDCANGVVLCKRNQQHMVVVWTRGGCRSMEEQRSAIQDALGSCVSGASLKLSFKSHVKAKNRNSKEGGLCILHDGRHARTASLEVHCGLGDSDYSPSSRESLDSFVDSPSSFSRPCANSNDSPGKYLGSPGDGANVHQASVGDSPDWLQDEDTQSQIRNTNSFVDLKAVAALAAESDEECDILLS